MIFAFFFVFLRICQIVTLIPLLGMLAWFVNIFASHNALTPDSILILFILSVLALAWTVFTLFSYHRSSANAHFVALVDLCFLGALIAGVYELRGIADADCVAPNANTVWYAPGHVPVPDFSWQPDKPCAMLKASWAFAIMNIIFFAATALAAYSHGGDLAYGDHDHLYVQRRRHHHHSSRHSHRHRSRSRGSRHSSHRSAHSHRRVYV
ncbi:hypothetical protein E4U42_003516 [Claviceps africana]|uniref:MARVEL domain-containing protein n=1 Tax=Claviceps africana TaxID=83212 RepID=A0A8K0J6G6_9HYPO|nr:hypothetical protein E4U42_003516 [Claviceps africana]